MDKWLKYNEKINQIANKFGNKISFLGSGSEGGVWSIDDKYVIKLHTNATKYSTTYFPEFEARIYEIGSLSVNLFWVIKEYLDTLSYEDFDLLYELILEINYYVELKSKKNLSEVFNIASANYISFLKNSKLDISQFKIIKDKYNLNHNWIEQLVFEITYKYITYRDLDFHPGNLGFKQDNRRPIFFDW